MQLSYPIRIWNRPCRAMELMRCANVADTGSLKVLFGLIKLSNPLTLLQAVYQTEKNTAFYR